MVKFLGNVGILFLCILADIFSTAVMTASLFTSYKKFWKLAIGKDQNFNAALGGSEDETLSSRAGRSMLRGEKWGCILCKLLDIVVKDHCIKSIEEQDK